jgi:rhodanese-related sulfurtransferase
MNRARFAAAAVLCSTLFVVPLIAAPDGPATQPTTQPKSVEKIDLAKFDALRKDADQAVLDVRTPREFADGHVPGAINVPIQSKEFDAAIAKLDPSKKYLVYCHSGKRSFLATQRMRAAGFENLMNFAGGIVAWEAAAKPMEGASDAANTPATKPAA